MAFLQAAEATFDSRVDSSKNKVSSEAVNEANKRRMSTASMYTTYHLLEPITVRETLERLRKNSVTLNTGGERGGRRQWEEGGMSGEWKDEGGRKQHVKKLG